MDPCILNPGELRHTVTILMPSPAGDAFGAAGTAWTPILTTRASLQQLASRQMYQTGALSTQASHKMRMRYRADIVIAAGYRVTFRTHVYQIVNADNILERNRVFELLLLEIGGAN